MVLADHGAVVIRLDRPGVTPLLELAGRGKRSIVVDLKKTEGRELAAALIDGADVLIEGSRPGVAERIGLGPDVCMARNQRLVYGRMTGWGQEGPMSGTAGHDIDYIASIGALHAIGRPDQAPVPPLNLVGDYGGGGMLLAFGVLAALLEARRTGKGQVVDAAMVDGAALLMEPIYELFGRGMWQDARGSNLLDGGAPFYDTYRTADGRWMAVGALEPPFYAAFLTGLGLAQDDLPDRTKTADWPRLRERIAAGFLTRTRDEWVSIFAGTDACVAPVLSMSEAPLDPHNRFRRSFINVGGSLQPAPAPRFALHAAVPPSPAPEAGEHTEQILAELGLDQTAIGKLKASGAVQ
jgi:alpha-methylacyl-CoA racemase